MPDLIFYQQVASLDKERHGKLKIAPLKDFLFVDRSNSCPLVAVEFSEAMKEFPIVFVKGADNSYLPVALLGLRDSENLFLKEDGSWDGRYIPAFIRRYPFAPADVGDGQLLMCIDEKAACFGETEGEPLFIDGEPSPLLKGVVALVQDYQAQAQRTQVFCKKLSDWNLLVEANAQARYADGSNFNLTGVYSVDENRLQVLDREKVMELFSSGDLGLIYAHLLSISNLQKLTEKLGEKIKH